MVKLNTPIRQPRSADTVMQEVSERAPEVLEHCFMDRDWIWYCGPALTGEANRATREALKKIGFRFSPGGHAMPDGKTTGHWGHSCQAPKFPRRKPKALPKDRTDSAKDLGALFRGLGM